MASDASATQANPYLIVLNNGKEVTRQKLTLVARPDVEKVYPQEWNATNSGYEVTFDLTQDKIAQLLRNHRYGIVSGYSADANAHGNDKQHTNFWSTPFTLNKNA